MLTRSSAIVTSRKRKLRELFAVATHAESLPRDGFTNPDATEPTPAESQFLQANDILQYVRAIDPGLFRGAIRVVDACIALLTTLSSSNTDNDP